MAQRAEKSSRLVALAAEAEEIGRVVHPADQSDGLGFGLAKRPDRILASAAARLDRSSDRDRAIDALLDPLEESPTSGHQRHVEPLVHVIRPLDGVMAIGTHEHRAVAVDTATKKVREELVRHRERPDRTALGRCEPDAQKPVVQSAVALLHLGKRAGRAGDSRDRRAEAEAHPQILDLLEVFGHQRHLTRSRRQIAVCRHQSKRVRDVRTPGNADRAGTRCRSPRPDLDSKLAESARDRRARASESCRDRGCRQALIDVEASKHVKVDGDRCGRHVRPSTTSFRGCALRVTRTSRHCSHPETPGKY